jgi:hypothetical protein
MPMPLTGVAMKWGGVKLAAERFFGLTADAMHVHVSILLLLFFALVTRRRLYHPMPWCLLLLTELVNEFIDLNQPSGSVENNLPASVHDMLNTMFLPTVLIVALRLRNGPLRFMRPDPHGA